MKLTMIKSAPLAAVLAFAAAPAQAVDFTFCDNSGNPYCDGVSINTGTIGSLKTVNGSHTGCHDGTIYGTFVYDLVYPGPAAVVGFGSTSAYTGLYTAEVSFAAPFPWRLVNEAAAVQNSGIMCFGVPAVKSAASAGGV